MLTRQDVLEAVSSWQNAGLKIIIRTEEQGRKYVDDMLNTYSDTDPEAWKLAARDLSHGKTWPRYSDIDEYLAKYKIDKQAKESKEAKARSPWKSRTPGMLEGETIEQFAERTARRRFCDASDETIAKMLNTSLLALCGIGVNDAICVACRHGELCKTYGHMPIPRIVQAVDGGFAYVETCVTREICYKYPDKKQRAVNK